MVGELWARCVRPAHLRMCRPLYSRLLGRDRFKTMQDAYCGVCILALYFMYLLVVKGALSVFDCSLVRCCLPRGVACCACSLAPTRTNLHAEQHGGEVGVVWPW